MKTSSTRSPGALLPGRMRRLSQEASEETRKTSPISSTRQDPRERQKESRSAIGHRWPSSIGAPPNSPMGPADRLSNHAPLHFDLSTFDIFAAAKAGACVVPVPPELSVFPRDLAAFLEKRVDLRVVLRPVGSHAPCSPWRSGRGGTCPHCERSCLRARSSRFSICGN